MQWTNEGGEASKLGGAHLHKGNVEALTWESTANTEHSFSTYDKVTMVSKTRKFLLLCYDWLARVSDIGHLVKVFRVKIACN